MTIEQSFFIEIIKLIPDNSVCYIQAPNLISNEIKKELKSTEYPYYQSLKINDVNRRKIISCILSESINEDIQSIEIRFNNILLFEGFDGVEYGTISKTIELPKQFVEKYVNYDFCNISVDW